MGCITSVYLQRYLVRIKQEQGKLTGAAQLAAALVANGFTFIPGIVEISGLGLGKEGTETFRYYDRLVKVGNTIRDLPPLVLTLRLDRGNLSNAARTFFVAWKSNSTDVTCSVTIDITDRNYCVKYSYQYKYCTITDLVEPGRSLGSPLIGVVSIELQPYDIVYKDLLTDTSTSGILSQTLNNVGNISI